MNARSGDLDDDADDNAFIPPVEFHCFSRPDVVFGFDEDGVVHHRRLGMFEERRTQQRNADEFELTLGALTVTLPFGLTIISGPTKIGKSRFLRHLTDQCGVVPFIACEPYDAPEDVTTSFAYRNADTALAAALHDVIHGQLDVIVAIDSLRAPLFETGGAAGSKGISMPFFTAVTRVSDSLATAGITALATVNPMDEDEDYQRAFLSKLSASAAATVLILSQDDGFRGTFELRDRFAGRMHRAPQSFRIAEAKAKSSVVSTPVTLAPATPVYSVPGISSSIINTLQGGTS